MHDPRTTINVTKVLAALCGTAGLALVVLNFWQGDDDSLGILGLTCIATGAVLRIRSWFVAVCERERNAFRLGRDYQRSRNDGFDDDNVRSLNI